MKGKKQLPRSLFGIFERMRSETHFLTMFISHLQSFCIVQYSEFRKNDGAPFPDIDALLKGVAERVQEFKTITENAEPFSPKLSYAVIDGRQSNPTTRRDDLRNAYLYGDLEIPIIMKEPTKFSQYEQMPGYVSVNEITSGKNKPVKYRVLYSTNHWNQLDFATLIKTL